MWLLVVLVLVILFCGGGYYGGHAGWYQGSPFMGGGIGLGGVLLICLVLYLLGVFR